MNDQFELQTHNYIKGHVWSLWNSYWLSQTDKVPPLHLLQVGASRDLFLVSAVLRSELEQFLLAEQNNKELRLHIEGDWVFDPGKWFGHWVCFTATPKQHFGMAVKRLMDETSPVEKGS